MSEYRNRALERLEKESKDVKGKKEGAMQTAVREALESFIRQDEEFAQAVVQGRSFAECMEAVAKGVGSSISDLDAYSKAVQFYFPGAGIKYQMSIDLCASVCDEEAKSTPDKQKILDLADFL